MKHTQPELPLFERETDREPPMLLAIPSRPRRSAAARSFFGLAEIFRRQLKPFAQRERRNHPFDQ